MITRSNDLKYIPDWQRELANAVADPTELLQLLQLDVGLLPAATRAARVFRLRVPRNYVARIKPGDPKDPLLRQVLPLDDELIQRSDFSLDPVGDLDAMVVPGLLHKYTGRVLLLTTGACAVHCRYCFRRNFPYADAQISSRRWRAALDYIRTNNTVNEVIFSGGDPLSLADKRLAEMVSELETIPHIRCIRFHTRQPVVLPSRVDQSLLDWLSKCRLQKVIVIHANHGNEIDAVVGRALHRLRTTGVSLLNQSVLLRGVNDSASVLRRLSEVLFDAGVVPYYLHLLDKAQGTAHFAVSKRQARNLVAKLRATLPGYLVPRLVCETPGKASKTPVA